MKIRHLIPVAGLALLALAAPASTPAASNAAKCSPKGTTAILATDTARVFQKRTKKDRQFDVYGCRYANGKVVKLGFRIERDTIGVDHFRLAGKYVALVYSDCDACNDEIQVFDLSTGKQTVSTDGTDPGGEDDSEPSVIELVLTPSGAIAWTAEGGDGTGRVVKLDKGGKKLLDRTDETDSLALSGNRIYWLKGTTPKTATLA